MTDERAIIAALVATVDRFVTTAGHLAAAETGEHLGVCSLRRHYVGGERVRDGSGYRIVNKTLDGTCAPSCVAAMSALAAGQDYLAATESKQLALLAVS